MGPAVLQCLQTFWDPGVEKLQFSTEIAVYLETAEITDSSMSVPMTLSGLKGETP